MADPGTRRFAVDPRWIVVAAVVAHWAMVLFNDVGITLKFLGLPEVVYGLAPRIIEILVGSALLWALFTRFALIAAIVIGLAAALAVAGAVAYAGPPARPWAWVQVSLALMVVAAAILAAIRAGETKAQ